MKKEWFDIAEITNVLTFLKHKFPDANVLQMDGLVNLLIACHEYTQAGRRYEAEHICDNFFWTSNDLQNLYDEVVSCTQQAGQQFREAFRGDDFVHIHEYAQVSISRYISPGFSFSGVTKDRFRPDMRPGFDRF